MRSINTPYANLEPSLILAAVESVGFRCSGSLFALNSFENRVYQIGIDDEDPVIAKFYRPNRWTDAAILEEHLFATELAALEIPVIAPLVLPTGSTLHHYADYRFALFPRHGGRSLEVDNLEQLEWMGRFLGRFHAVGAATSFQHRMRLDVQSYGYQPYTFLCENHFIPEELKHNYCRVVEAILQLITRRFESMDAIKYIRLHGDCHAGNVLWRPSGPHIVDLDDCLMGPAVQDIWMLLPGGVKHETEVYLHKILDGYEEFIDFDYRELRLIEYLRTLRMIHYAGWLARRWEDPAFPASFPWFNTPRYWQDQLSNMQEQWQLLVDESDEG